VTVNVVAVLPTGAGNLGMYPSQVPAPPNTATINFTKGATIGNGAIAPLADQSVYPKDLTVRVYVGGSNAKVDVVLDVTGYFQ
jgi:hypothetical protein